MRVLLIEDIEEFLNVVVPRLESIAGAPENLTVAKSRDSAIKAMNDAALKAEFYDIFILDLSIPPTDHRGVDHVDHGMAVLNHAQHCAPRTPVYILTRADANPIVNKLLLRAEKIDVWGDQRLISTLQLWPKIIMDELFDELRLVARCVAETDEIAIDTRGVNLQLSPQQRRVLRVFARRRESRSCEVSALAGGLSGSRVFRVTARDDTGHIHIVAAGKIADIETVDDEAQRFDQHVQQLRSGAFPTKIEVVRSGAGLSAGVFYWLLNADSQSLFSFLAVDPEQAATVVAKVQNLTQPWINGEATVEVADIRRRLVGDEEAAELVRTHGLTWDVDFEAKLIQTKWACLHGDLHGGNVLVDGNGTPLLIDFSEVGRGAAPIDPITLELSLLFHPDFQQIRGAWPPIDTAARWADISRYTQGCPCPAFIEACRKWSHAVAAGDGEVYASAYAYLLLQLRYSNTDKKLISTLLDAVQQSFKAACAR
jgi:hypothetical protein